jgi:hypothetical protein
MCAHGEILPGAKHDLVFKHANFLCLVKNPALAKTVRQARDRRKESLRKEAFLCAAINGSQAHPGTMTGPAANLTNGALQTSGLPEFDLADLEFFGAFISLFHGIGLRFGFGARVYTHV